MMWLKEKKNYLYSFWLEGLSHDNGATAKQPAPVAEA